jgi:hypothetical protein
MRYVQFMHQLSTRPHRHGALFLVVILVFAAAKVSNFALAQTGTPDLPAWRADHHMHLASPELCHLVGECLASNKPPAVFATDAVIALDRAHVSKGVILSCAYLYGLASLHLKPAEVAAMTRKENEFTAAQVAQYPARLVGFLSVDPLADSAIEEIRHWHGSRQLIGLKLHLTASSVDIRNDAKRRKVAEVIAEAAAEGLPIVIHIGGGKFNGADAQLFIRDVLPSAGSSWFRSRMLEEACRGMTATIWRSCARSPTILSKKIPRHGACFLISLTCRHRAKRRRRLPSC